MANTWTDLMKHYPRLSDSTEGDDIMTVLDAELTVAQKDALVLQLESLIDITIADEIVELRASVRAVAAQLPADDTLRIAVEGVPE